MDYPIVPIEDAPQYKFSTFYGDLADTVPIPGLSFEKLARQLGVEWEEIDLVEHKHNQDSFNYGWAHMVTQFKLGYRAGHWQENEIKVARNWAMNALIQGSGDQMFKTASDMLDLAFVIGTFTDRAYPLGNDTFLNYTIMPVVEGITHRITVSRIMHLKRKGKRVSLPPRMDSVSMILRLRDSREITGLYYTSNHADGTNLLVPVMVGIPLLNTVEPADLRNYKIRVMYPDENSIAGGFNPNAPQAVQYYPMAVANGTEILRSTIEVFRSSLNNTQKP